MCEEKLPVHTGREASSLKTLPKVGEGLKTIPERLYLSRSSPPPSGVAVPTTTTAEAAGAGASLKGDGDSGH